MFDSLLKYSDDIADVDEAQKLNAFIFYKYPRLGFVNNGKINWDVLLIPIGFEKN